MLACPTGTPSDKVATAGCLALLATQSRPATKSEIVPVPCKGRLGFWAMSCASAQVERPYSGMLQG